ncbi:MAG: zinc dependent phospholipase C family protein [Firmicutes bacterium]|nr:zinc dependent phospholipase C family protein [Bacillota bacterium]
MPNIITHILFARDMKDRVEESLRTRIENNQQLFEIGSNGPDFCFFYGTDPRKHEEKLPISKIGTDMHKGNVNDFYRSCLESIRAQKDEQIKEDMTVYVWGHLCHWALDSTTHPYVMYRTGDTNVGNASWWHHRFESCLDAILLKLKTGLTTKDFKAKEICDVSKEKARAICRIYIPFIHNVFGIQEVKAHHLYQSLQDWYFIQNVLYDAKGMKHKVVSNIEKVFGVEHALSGLLVPHEPIDDYDILNLNHDTWLHPADASIVSTDSMLDLFDQALNKAENVIRLFNKALENPKFETDLFNYIGDRNYNLNMDQMAPMVNFDLIQDRM